MIIYETGDIVELAKEGKFNFIIQGCNCQSTWGSGLARSLREAFPDAFLVDKKDKRLPFDKIGDFSYWRSPNQKLTIINAYTQFDYGTDYRRAEYGSIKRAFEGIFSHWRFSHLDRVATVKIGAGLGGGNWEVISDIIQTITNFYGVDLYVLSK